ncbi:DUF4334 domain-containing protein [Patescibacteria group bacterium]
MKTFEELIQNHQKTTKKDLNKFFESLEPVNQHELTGFWQGSYFPTGSKMEVFLKNFVILRWVGKIFLPENKVKALIFSFLGAQFNIPCFGKSTLKKTLYRNKQSASINYQNLPIIDYLRKIDDEYVMGIMEMNEKVEVYFYLKKYE